MGEYDDDHHLLIFMNMDPSWVTSSGMMDPMDVLILMKNMQCV